MSLIGTALIGIDSYLFLYQKTNTNNINIKAIIGNNYAKFYQTTDGMLQIDPGWSSVMISVTPLYAVKKLSFKKIDAITNGSLITIIT